MVPGMILQEPDILKDEKSRIERGLQTTAVTQYGAFIETARCLQVMSTELSSVCEHLDLLLQVCALGRQQMRQLAAWLLAACCTPRTMHASIACKRMPRPTRTIHSAPCCSLQTHAYFPAIVFNRTSLSLPLCASPFHPSLLKCLRSMLRTSILQVRCRHMSTSLSHAMLHILALFRSRH